jgi:hypothetical protein
LLQQLHAIDWKLLQQLCVKLLQQLHLNRVSTSTSTHIV